MFRTADECKVTVKIGDIVHMPGTLKQQLDRLKDAPPELGLVVSHANAGGLNGIRPRLNVFWFDEMEVWSEPAKWLEVFDAAG